MSALRVEVARFALAMQAKMEAIENRIPPRHVRGDWMREPVAHLWDHLEEELSELAEAKHGASRAELQDELVDAANMLAFIWNRVELGTGDQLDMLDDEHAYQALAQYLEQGPPGPDDDQYRSLDP